MVLSVYLLALTFIWTGMASKFVVSPCDPHLFDDCLSDFNRSMESSGYRESCPWPTAKRNYDLLKTCVDDWATATICRGHGSPKDDIFLAVHKTYFKRCEKFQDPPPTTLAALIAPGVVVTLFMPIVFAHLATRNAYRLDSPGL
ncbi:Receptor activity-modifying protein 1 [Liparis tanakae]|uniref:Receptor activity-modifying protein 1 n=1 Tax=Liparis tanakae TaxID=230148 RepID=A0A4Z2H5X9_9TELE|nr:Receptor activity-modifying protein 1 [Liparis tanakae]